MIIEIYPRHSMTQIFFLIAFQTFLLLLQSFISVNKTSSLYIVMQLKWKHQNETKIFISFPSNSLVFISSIDMIGFFLSLHDNDDNIIEIQLNFLFIFISSSFHSCLKKTSCGSDKNKWKKNSLPVYFSHFIFNFLSWIKHTKKVLWRSWGKKLW